MVIARWSRWRARRRSERFVEAERAAARAFEILDQVAEPLVAAEAARVERHTADWGDDGTHPVAELRPEGQGCAAVSVEPVPGAGWIDVAVGRPYPGGAVHELDLVDGWEEELRACVHAVIEGRYRYREYEGRFGGTISEMAIVDADGEERTISTRSSPDEPSMPTEESYGPYLAAVTSET